MRQRTMPPPEAFTLTDGAHLLLAALMIPLGVIILVRALPLAATLTSILTAVLFGCAFVAFGVYRLWQGVSRYSQLRKRGNIK